MKTTEVVLDLFAVLWSTTFGAEMGKENRNLVIPKEMSWLWYTVALKILGKEKSCFLDFSVEKWWFWALFWLSDFIWVHVILIGGTGTHVPLEDTISQFCDDGITSHNRFLATQRLQRSDIWVCMFSHFSCWKFFFLQTFEF